MSRSSLQTTFGNSAGLLVVLAVLTAAFSLSLDRFLTAATLQSILNQIPALTFVSVGMTFVLITGGIDLSVGSLVALTSASLGMLMVKHQWSFAAAGLLVPGIGLLAGLLNGLISSY